MSTDQQRDTNFKGLLQKNGVDVLRPFILSFVINGGGSVPATGGQNAWLTVPQNCTITGWQILGDVSGAIVLDVWKDTYANFPPTNTDSITASAKPTITASGVKATSTTLTGWTTALALGDILDVEVESVTAIKYARLDLFCTPA